MNKDMIINQFYERYPSLGGLKEVIDRAADTIISSFSSGGKLLICGNGGSSAEADHMAGELMKSFERARPLDEETAGRLSGMYGDRGAYLSAKLECGLPAISLSSQTALVTAISNDIDGDLIFAQQVIGYGCKNDVLFAISSSGNSANVVDACITAKAMYLKVIGLTGTSGGRMKEYCDMLINVPEKNTALVQELHLPVIHIICRIIESHFYKTQKKV
jgi:D-sedoheptulose 7-phosphate isomerase